MKKLTIFLIINYSLLIINCSAQGWQWQNQIPTGNNLNSVYFLNADTGYAVGGFGTIIKTTDGGDTWTLRNIPTEQSLNSVLFINNNTGFAVGDSGIMLKTTNGGENWILQNFGSSYNLNTVFFVDNNNGLIAGNPRIGVNSILLKTTDGGNNWSSNIINNFILYSVYFTDINTGYAYNAYSPYNDIYKTTDSGTNWFKLNSSIHSSYLLSLFFTNANTGIAVGIGNNGGIIFKTTDAGNTWSSQLFNRCDFYSVYFSDSINGYVIGDSAYNNNYNPSPNTKGIIFKTSDGGNTWERQYLDTLENGYFAFTSVYFIKKGDFKVGYTIGSAGRILKTTNGGERWINKSKSVTYFDLSSVVFTDSYIGYAVGGSSYNKITDGVILKTTNAGKNWHIIYKDTSKLFNSVCISDGNTIYVCGSSGTILKTTDAGVHWLELNSGTSLNLIRINFSDKNTGYSVALYYGTIIKTTDNGNNWNVIRQDSNMYEYLLNIYFINRDTGFAIGENGNGIILKTINGGKKWNNVYNGNYFALEGIYFTDSNTGYVTGTGLLRTYDGGDNWIEININSLSRLEEICFPDKNIGYVTTDDAKIFKTTDGGKTWNVQWDNSYLIPESIYFTDVNTGYVVGQGGMILKTTDGGGTWMHESGMKNEELGINVYPNPTNNLLNIELITTSNYQIFKLSNLQIINFQGQVLIEKKLLSDKMQINVENLPAGIYFIKISDAQTIKVAKFIKE